MYLFNTLTKKKESFVPLEDNLVRMYVCGVTVYDDGHLGHARSAVVFDVLRRYLVFKGYRVTYVKNYTDIDDKIINRALKENRPWTEIVTQYIEAYSRDMQRLKVSKPDVEPRATEHMPEIIDMIAQLVEKAFAYQINGDVYYEVRAYKDYGRLSGRKEEELLAGARVEVDERKKNPMDFALWKTSKPGEPGWESPWGNGRPGWHIECSAMSIRHLGKTFDIHGGGRDLVFPHHENEVAQSCAYTGQEFARYWVHNGFVTIDDEKMSKSLGNFFTIKEIFEKSNWKESVTGETLRYFLLSTHYRSDLNFSDKALSEAKSAVDNLYDLFIRLEEPELPRNGTHDQDLERALAEFEKQFDQAMDDDLNTPKVLGEFQRLRGEINKLVSKGLSGQAKKKAMGTFLKFGAPLGLWQMRSKDWEFSPFSLGVIPELDEALASQAGPSLIRRPAEEFLEGAPGVEWINRQIENRKKARERKDFAEADKIRQELASKGIILEDRPDGTTRWKR